MKKCVILCVLIASLVGTAWAQPETLLGLQKSFAANKKALANYSWRETETLSVDGQVKQTKISTVEVGPDGHLLKAVVSESTPPKNKQRGPIRKRVRKRKAGEFKDYVKSVASLAQQYAHPDKEKLRAAFENGDVKKNDSVGTNLASITVENYLKKGDSLTIVYHTPSDEVSSIRVNSYLKDPSETVEVVSDFSKFADGNGSHVSQTKILGQKKQLTIKIANSDYVPRK